MADQGNNRIIRIVEDEGGKQTKIVTLASDKGSDLRKPYNIVAWKDDFLFIQEEPKPCVRKLDKKTGRVSTVFVGRDVISSIAVTMTGHLVLSYKDQGTIEVVHRKTGETHVIAGGGKDVGKCLATQASLKQPGHLLVRKDGSILFAEGILGNVTIRRLKPEKNPYLVV